MSGANVTIAGDLTISGDDLTMATNTSGAVLVGDGSNYNPAVVSGDISIGTTGVAAIGSGVILNADVNSSAAIDATKIHDGTISNTEFGYLNGVSSNIQTQIDAVESATISTLDDDNFTLQDNADTSKKAQFQCSGISTSTTRTFTFPDSSGTLSVGALSDIVSDTSPQLGGDLDVNGQDIVSTSNADIDIAPHGTGDVVLKADTVTVGDAAAAATLRSSGAGTLTVTTGGTTDLILSTNNGTNSGTVTITDAVNEAITLAPNGTGIVDIQGSMNPSLSSTGKSMVMGL